jgi:Tol biopolymer transport system component
VRDLQSGTTARISVDNSGAQANGNSYYASISADGRYVAFYSGSSNLVAGDTNGSFDIFVRDRQTGTTTLASINSSGVQADLDSSAPSISAGGRYVAFVSSATNLVTGDTNGKLDVFLRDLLTGTTTRASVGSGGIQSDSNSSNPTVSADGRYVAFTTVASNVFAGDTNGVSDVLVRDVQTGTTIAATTPAAGALAAGNGVSDYPSISADGRYVAFYSSSTNLVAGDTNGANDAFLRDLQTGVTTRVSLDGSGNQGNNSSYNPSVSADGRYVAFYSLASNLVPGDTNSSYDVFVRDLQNGTTTRVSLDSSGNQGNNYSFNPSISANGRFVAFYSNASNLVPNDTNGSSDVFVRDLQSGTTTRVSLDSNGNQGNGVSSFPSISADGRYVAFSSGATNLVPGDTNGKTDVFVRDLQTGTTTRVSVDSNGNQGNNGSQTPSMSADGRYVAFFSDASNLVPGDTNGATDVFVRDLQTGTTTRVTLDSSGNQADGGSDLASISAHGRYVTFRSFATNLVAGDTNGSSDVFVRDLQNGTTARLSLDSNGNQGNGASSGASISADGGYITFVSSASNLVAGDGNSTQDIFRTLSPFANTPPQTINGSDTVDEDQTLNIDLRPLVADAETADSDLTYTIVSTTHGDTTPTGTAGVFIFTPTTNYNGQAVVTFNVTDPDGLTSSPDSTFTITVSPVNDAGTVSISGTVTEDQTLTASVTDSDGVSGAISYQWQRFVGGAWTDIAGATNSTYTLGDADVAYQICVLASYTDDQGNAENLTSAATGNVVNVNDAPVANSDTATTAEDIAVSGTLAGSDADGDTLTFAIATGPSHGALTSFNAATGAYTYTPNANYHGSDSFTFTANDGTVDSAEATIELTITSVNDAPSLDASASPTFGTMAEDTKANNIAGVLVSSLLAGASADLDGDALGIAVVALGNPAKGKYQYQLPSGAWLAMPNVSESNSLLLPADALVRFVPNVNVNGVVKLYFSAWDGTAGTSGTTLSLLGQHGGAGSVSNSFAIATATVTPVNDAPVLDTTGTPSFGVVSEDAADPPGVTVASLLSGKVLDVDGDSVGIAVIGLGQPAKGTYQYQLAGGAWTSMGSVSETSALLLPPAARVRFLGGKDYFGTVDLYYRAWDGIVGSAGSKQSFAGQYGGTGSVSAVWEKAVCTVTPVNDAPVLTPSNASPIGYRRGQPSIVLMGGSTLVQDVDSPTFLGGQLTVTGIGLTDVVGISGRFSFSGSDVLYTPDGKPAIVIGTRNAGGGNGTNLTITFESTATLDLVQRLVRSLRFSSTGSAGSRDLQVSLSDDHQELSNVVYRTVSVA